MWWCPCCSPSPSCTPTTSCTGERSRCKLGVDGAGNLTWQMLQLDGWLHARLLSGHPPPPSMPAHLPVLTPVCAATSSLRMCSSQPKAACGWVTLGWPLMRPRSAPLLAWAPWTICAWLWPACLEWGTGIECSVQQAASVRHGMSWLVCTPWPARQALSALRSTLLRCRAPEVVGMPSPDTIKRLGLAPHQVGHYGCKVGCSPAKLYMHPLPDSMHCPAQMQRTQCIA